MRGGWGGGRAERCDVPARHGRRGSCDSHVLDGCRGLSLTTSGIASGPVFASLCCCSRLGSAAAAVVCRDYHVFLGGRRGGVVLSRSLPTLFKAALPRPLPPTLDAGRAKEAASCVAGMEVLQPYHGAAAQLPATATARPTAIERTRQAVKRQVNDTFRSGWSRCTEVPRLSPNSGTPRHCLAHFCASSGLAEGSLCISPPLECTLPHRRASHPNVAVWLRRLPRRLGVIKSWRVSKVRRRRSWPADELAPSTATANDGSSPSPAAPWLPIPGADGLPPP